MIVLRKRLAVDQGQMRLFEEYRYFFFITNDRTTVGSRNWFFWPTTGATRRT